MFLVLSKMLAVLSSLWIDSIDYMVRLQMELPKVLWLTWLQVATLETWFDLSLEQIYMTN
jgi:hypothetical protein